MAIINKLDNTASVLIGTVETASNTVTTLLNLPPTLVKTVDLLTAVIGDTLTYTVVITNLNLAALSNIAFTDIIPTGCEYVPGSFKLNGSAVTPTIAGQTLTYTLASLAALGVATFSFQGTVIGGTI